MNFYFIAASYLLQKIWNQAQYSLLHDSIHYRIVFVSCKSHTFLIIGTAGSELMNFPLKL